ncbi:MAG: hypothetical protein U0796_13095 [Gemmatales bacterium]
MSHTALVMLICLGLFAGSTADCAYRTGTAIIGIRVKADLKVVAYAQISGDPASRKKLHRDQYYHEKRLDHLRFHLRSGYQRVNNVAEVGDYRFANPNR